MKANTYYTNLLTQLSKEEQTVLNQIKLTCDTLDRFKVGITLNAVIKEGKIQFSDFKDNISDYRDFKMYIQMRAEESNVQKPSVLRTHRFILNKHLNSGEQISINTEFCNNGDEITETTGVYINQTIELQSYGNAMSLIICDGCLTPEELRKLADELDQVRKEIAHK